MSREERRRRLLAGAEELFGQKGYRKTEVEELARKAGVTKPMLYRHFPGGKAELFMAVLDEHMSELLRALWEAMASHSDPRVRLHRGIDAYLRFAEANPDAFHLFVLSSVELDPGFGDRLRRVRETIARGLTNTIADVMKAAGLQAEGAPLYAHALLGGVESVVSWWLESGARNRDQIVDHLVAFVWRGFDGLPRDPARFHLEHSQGR
ncbi:MAG: TetR/AcrR family transcriptional regulator [Actinomycetota bacterium]|nr:TetR/AcrR family transcriptional regulator [Actinomycetota bacterium]